MPALLVPLDGSDASRTALPVAKAIAHRLGYSIRLLTVIDATEHLGSAIAHERATQAAREALASMAADLTATGLRVSVDVRFGETAAEIDDAASTADVVFTVMSSHGRSGLGRWMRGSVADRVVRRGSSAVLVVGPAAGLAPAGITRVLVALDGSALAETAVETAVVVARAFDADLDLVRVVPWTGAIGAGADAGLLASELEEELEFEALHYLESVREKLGYPKAHGLVLRGNAADEIVTYAGNTDVALIVVTTHGRSGIVRMALGSVADRLIASGVAPVLLVRAGRVAAGVKRTRCFSCGRAAPDRDVESTDTCLRCGRHLHVCDNCVFFTGSLCLRGRPDAVDTPRGQVCPDFLHRETPPPTG